MSISFCLDNSNPITLSGDRLSPLAFGFAPSPRFLAFASCLSRASRISRRCEWCNRRMLWWCIRAVVKLLERIAVHRAAARAIDFRCSRWCCCLGCCAPLCQIDSSSTTFYELVQRRYESLTVAAASSSLDSPPAHASTRVASAGDAAQRGDLRATTHTFDRS
jgi:hypothetical protein